MIISTRDVKERMVVLRKQAVIADADVALLYGVQTKEINQAVRNNRDKFPNDYVFELNDNELRTLRSIILTTNRSEVLDENWWNCIRKRTRRNRHRR
jgi:hypothetical protein